MKDNNKNNEDNIITNKNINYEGKDVNKTNDKSSDIINDNVLYRLSLNPNKGGLQNVDKEKVNKIIYDVSKVSKNSK